MKTSISMYKGESEIAYWLNDNYVNKIPMKMWNSLAYVMSHADAGNINGFDYHVSWNTFGDTINITFAY